MITRSAYPAPRLHAGPVVSERGFWAATLLLLTLLAFVLRSGQFFNPIDGLDEQLYFYIGDRMLQGAIPYVDLWDRKPYGLFALFAAMRWMGGPDMAFVKIVATGCAALTALIVSAIANRTASRGPAVLAGAFYLIATYQLWGAKPQTAIYYNLPITFAFWLTLDCSAALASRGDRSRVFAAMLLAGLCIQIKTNAVFEGASLGAWVLWRMLRAQAPVQRIAGMTAGMVLLGILPTIAVGLGYAKAGHFGDFWFANFESLLLKRGTLGAAAQLRVWSMLALVAPVLTVLAWGLYRATGGGRRWTDHLVLLAAWSVAGMVDAVAIGGFWPHYALPLAVPAAILSAHAFATPRLGPIAFTLLSAYPVAEATVLDRISAIRTREIAARTVAAIPDDVRTTCMFIYEGPVIYYHLKQACTVTRFVFSDHLRSSAEAHALPEDATRALREALAARPGVILGLEGSTWKERNLANDRIMAGTLARDYVPIARLPHHYYYIGREWLVVWRRRDLVRNLSKLGGYQPSASMKDGVA